MSATPSAELPAKKYGSVMRSTAGIFAVLLLLSGCAMPEYRSAKLKDPNDGAMAVRILPNRNGVSQFFKTWQVLEVVRSPDAPGGTEAHFEVGPLLDGMSRSALYAGSLPPGHYRFVKLSAMSCGALCVQSSLMVNPHFSGFDVQSGKLTDLNVLVQSDPPSFLGAGNVMLSHDEAALGTETTEIIDELAPGLKPVLVDAPLSWTDSPAAAAAQAKANLLARQFSTGSVSPEALPDGRIIYGSANGVVFEWTPGQRPVAHDIGMRRSVESVLVTTDGAWIAGGELSMLQLTRDQGKNWGSIRGDLPLALILDVHQWRDQLVTTTLRGQSVAVYRSGPYGGSWTRLGSYEMSLSAFWDIPGIRPQSFLIGDHLITTLPGRKLADMNLETAASEIRDLPGSLQMFSASPDGVLRCRCQAAIAVNPYESHDMGRTWTSSAAARFMLMPTFRDALHGVAFLGHYMSANKLVYTEDGGNTWIETVDVPADVAYKFVYSKDGKAVYAMSSRGSIWGSFDDGRTWKTGMR